MRHLLGVGLAIVMAAALFFGAGWAIERMAGLSANGGDLTSIHGLTSLAAMLGAGLLLGLVMCVPRISPLSSGLPGLGLLALTALYMVSRQRALSYIPFKSHDFGAGFQSMLGNGVLALVGLAMVIPLLVPSRWRRPDVTEYEDIDVPERAGLLL